MLGKTARESGLFVNMAENKYTKGTKVSRGQRVFNVLTYEC
jgi:hypothetical protein